MEFVIPIVSSIFTKAAEYTISPIINHVKYLSSHQQNVKKLKDARDRVRHSVDAAQRKGEEIERDVNNWMSAVDRKIPEQVEEVMQDEEKAKKKCFFGLCPKFWTRYLKAAEEAKAVAELLEQGNFNRVSYPVPLQSITYPPVKGYEEFESRTLVLNKIMEALKDDSVSVIGVHGMGGIGKTTLVKEIARKVKGKDKLFDSVVISTVTQDVDIGKIQNTIAEFLGLKFEEQSTDLKALRLRERLKKEKRVLVVLDDIWGKVDIEEVGIPLGDEHKGCKLLLTSRELNVLSNGMDAQKHFSIRLLNEKEAWDLFKKKAGDCVESCDLKPTAMEVAKKCAGLPIAIATVAGALRNKRLFEWKNALQELERHSSSNFTGITNVRKLIELSFNYLESEEVKLTFLLCCVMGHNGLVEDLVRYTVGLGLFGDVNTVEDARNTVLTVVANLKASSLLLDGYNDKHFDIHDVVSDAALVIASRDHRMLVLRDYVPMEWSDKKKMNSWSWISLTCPQIIAELPKELECSGLSFFHMTHNSSVKIPPHFFRRIESLRVLDLHQRLSFPYLRESITHLRESINHLINLRMLRLRGCPVEDMTIIGELKNLEILNLACSSIKVLPKEIANLSRLRLLDLSGCRALRIIPPNVLSSLSKLEEIYMEGSFDEWENEGVVGNKRRNACLDELNNLPRLTTLNVHIPDVQMIPKHQFIETLDRYSILVDECDIVDSDYGYKYSRTLGLNIFTNVYWGNGVKMLLKKTEYLYLHLVGLEGIKSGLAELNSGEEFSNLKRVDVSIKMEESEPVPFFNNQTSLWISNLTSLSIDGCGNLEHLLSPSMAKRLKQLQHFDIVNCMCLREIIFTKEIVEEEEREDVICFPQLNSLRIKGIPDLIFFCSGNFNIEFPLLKELTIWDCPKLKEFISKSSSESGMHTLFNEKVAVPSLETMTISMLSNVKMIFHTDLPPNSFHYLRNLSVSECESLKNLLPATIAKHLPQLKDLSIRNCQCLNEIIFTEEIEEEGKDVICFPRLNSLRMDCLRNLIFFCPGDYNIEFHLLKELEIKDCPKLKEFISESSTESGMHTLFNEKVAVPSLERMTISMLSNVKMIFHTDLSPNSFQNLRELRISRCEILKNLFPASIAKHLLQLEDLSIIDCGVEEIVSKGKVVEDRPMRFELPKVSSLEVRSLKELKCFYKGKHTMVWPMLKKLTTDGSGLVMRMGLEDVRMEERKGNGEAVLAVEEVFPNLQQLELRQLSDEDQFPPNLFHHVKVLKVNGGFCGGFPFLRKICNPESFDLECFSFRDGLPCKGDVGTPSRIKKLILYDLRNLQRMWRKDSELGHILSNLQTLTIDSCHDLINIGASSLSFKNLTTLKVSNCAMMTNLVTPLVVESLVQLTTMEVSSCTKMTEIVAHEGDYHQTIVVGKLKCLKLSYLQSLTSVFRGSYTFNFPCLKEVVVVSCPKLKIFSEGVLSTPQLQRVKQGFLFQKECWAGDLNTTIQQLYIQEEKDLTFSDTFPELEIWQRNPREILELQNIGKMEFYKCSSLEYIFTSSMLLSLKQLRQIEVKECSIMEQVIREDEEEATAHELKFPQLYCVKMESCSNLTNFYLGSRALEFPYLSSIMIAECPKMTALSSSISKRSEKVIGEQDVEDKTAALFCDKVPIPNLIFLTLSSINIHKIWHHPSSSSLTRLNYLRVEGCHNLKYLFPSFLVKDLVQLRVLEIKDCNMMEQVIFTDGLATEDQWRNHTIFSKLERLSLEDLPKLKDTCFENDFEFPCLRGLTLTNCPLLKTFISKSISGDEPQIHQPIQTNNSVVLNQKVIFPPLENLHIQNCDSLEEIIELQGLTANESQSTSATRSTMAETVMTKFVFPHVTNLVLDKVRSLNMHTTQWPSLKQMKVIECPKAQIFDEVEIPNQQPLFCVNEDTFPVLQELTLKTSDMMKGICDGQLSLQCFPNLKLLNLQFFPGTSTTLPYSFIRSLPNLQKLVISNAFISEMVRSEGLSHKERHTSAFSQLKELSLSELPEMTLKTLSEGLINEERHTSACYQLEVLRLSQLPELTLKTLEPFLLSFKNLLSMEVSRCHGFINLMACSTAKSLTLLESLSIDDCEMIQEIIACEGEEIQGNIVFPKLKYLELSCLPSLASFSLAHHLLEFPVLRMVKVKKCPKMTNFFQGELSTPRLEQTHLTGDEDGELQWEGDLNTTIKHMFHEMNVQNSQVIEVTDRLLQME
ncbi:hypothetical protein CXB51_024974 [Gossypium anomalum]|uniref:AAA+ ATPase domain-containing protein n=1 Tax=Gossypium anomalum TaxID=47600 RepID=A0A8J6CRL8_9ROSI|nr:hypothetical protein CXB51_024974 [Gossypium anomalum]